MIAHTTAPQTTSPTTAPMTAPMTAPTIAPTIAPTTSVVSEERPDELAAVSQSSSSSLPRIIRKNRFPPLGTSEFNQTCQWALETHIDLPFTCSILVRQMSGSEGISAWVAMVGAAFVMSKQTGCSFHMVYSKGINITDIMVPTPGIMDWRMSDGYNCHPKNNCSTAWPFYHQGGGPKFADSHSDYYLAAIPNYRNSYGHPKFMGNSSANADLKRSLGDSFNFDTSMGCAFGSLIQLSPKTIEYEPNLFTTILPTLHDPKHALVLSLYIRTGRTENLQLEEQMEKYRTQAEHIIDCAKQVEKENNITEETRNSGQGAVVWMLLTDSQYLKTWIKETYSNDTQRIILTTQSRGAHTKVTRSNEASTADFAEAFLDWYLIGEADAVIADFGGPTFGSTASFRTSRPYYKVASSGKSCNNMVPGHKWE